MISVHINNHCAKRRAIAKNVLFAVRTVMCEEQVDMVAGDFNGAAWRRKNGDDQQRDRTIKEAFANTNLPIPHGPTPLWGPGGVPGEWADVCGFIKPQKTSRALACDRWIQASWWQLCWWVECQERRDWFRTPWPRICHSQSVDHHRIRNAVRSEQHWQQGKERGNLYDHL